MAKLVGLNQWVNRTTRVFIVQTSSGEMERLFPGEVLHDISGEPTSNANWIHAPDLSAVVGFRNIYWIVTGDVISLMSLAGRDAVDLAIQDAARDSAISADVDRLEGVLRQVVKLTVRELNILRQQFNTTTAESNQLTDTAFVDRTLAQVRNQLRSGLGT